MGSTNTPDFTKGFPVKIKLPIPGARECDLFYVRRCIARWPDPYSGHQIRIEHWVLAERQGQVAGRNILGYREPFEAVPFFWTQQFGVALRYVGHAEKWDAVQIDGILDAQDCAVSYKQSGKTVALATIGRDIQSLQFEAGVQGLLGKFPRTPHS